MRRVLVGVVVAAAFALAAPFVVPVTHFIPKLTRLAAEKLGQPVAMEGLTLHLVPMPRIIGHRISVGRRSQLLIGELEIEPDFAALASGRLAIGRIRAHRVVLDEDALAIPRGMPKSRPGEPVLVRRLTLTAVKLNHSGVNLPLFDADIHLGEDFRLREALFLARDRSLSLRVKASGPGAFALTLQANRWTLPAGAPLFFETLDAQATLRNQQLELTRIEGVLYGGKVAATGQAGWGKQWELGGTAQLAGVDLVPLQKALGKPAKLSGRLNAEAVFSTRAKTPAELGAGLMIDGPFEVQGGVYKGVDLARAGELSGGEGGAGEATKFEELRGLVELRGERVKLEPLCMRSPSVVAGGKVDIAPDKTLSGRLDISIAQTGGILGVPVTLGGTTDEPTMRPSKGYLIGAAIGTVLMPGIGTSIGSALGGRIEGGSGCK
jgi:hypothetical protein